MPRLGPGALPRRDFRLVGMLADSSNAAMVVELPGEPPRHAVYKPQAGERPLWDFPEGTLCHREVAASIVAEEMGFPAIPTTILITGPLGLGALADYVELRPDLHFFTLRDRFPLEMRKIAAFDVVTNNADRKGGHVAMAADGTIVSLDHGLCFHVEHKLRTVIWDYVGEPLPAEVVEGLVRLDRGLATGARLHADLEGLLDEDELAALRDRARGLLVEGIYPEPQREPIYPWPPI